MSEEISPLSPQLQEQLQRLQQQQQTLQLIISQKQQLELELSEIERAIVELEKSEDNAILYKSIGAILVKSEKAKLIKELRERKELTNTRLTVLSRQQKRSEERVKEMQKSVQERINQMPRR